MIATNINYFCILCEQLFFLLTSEKNHYFSDSMKSKKIFFNGVGSERAWKWSVILFILRHSIDLSTHPWTRVWRQAKKGIGGLFWIIFILVLSQPCWSFLEVWSWSLNVESVWAEGEWLKCSLWPDKWGAGRQRGGHSLKQMVMAWFECYRFLEAMLINTF